MVWKGRIGYFDGWNFGEDVFWIMELEEV